MINIIDSKICTVCNIDKPLSEFYINRNHKDNLCSQCKICNNTKNKYYYTNNKEKEKIRYTKWRINNPDYQMIWQVNNADKWKIIKKRASQKYYSRLQNKLHYNISKGIQKAIKNKKAGRKWTTIVGWDITDLIAHITPLLHDGMNWENYGKWHIDHIIPKAFFIFKDYNDVEFQYCWSLINLQPLWGRENSSKNDRIMEKYLV